MNQCQVFCASYLVLFVRIIKWSERNSRRWKQAKFIYALPFRKATTVGNIKLFDSTALSWIVTPKLNLFILDIFVWNKSLIKRQVEELWSNFQLISKICASGIKLLLSSNLYVDRRVQRNLRNIQSNIPLHSKTKPKQLL